MEYEYSYKVDDLKEFLDYINSNYEFIKKYKEKRVIYRNNDTIARITFIDDDIYLDFKENKISDDPLIVRKESKQVKIDNLENCEDILSFLNYKKDNTLLRYRSIYEKNNIKFEIDEYIEPNHAYVVSFEGDKEICDSVNEDIKMLLKKEI
ncbi:MAG: hypothetical protein IJ568_06800 [Bacilli bacterium]|nr:hypothetical protein [Bacilli bacterium]